jgi:uncharacterized membrane protein YbhN (UPF0104 family)
MYAGSISALAYILKVSLRLYGKILPYSEIILLTGYSSIANFFGPGQSGPGVRAVYLKLRHGVSIKQFLFVTLIYFAWLILISSSMFSAATLPWWLTSMGVFGMTAACTIAMTHLVGMDKNSLVPPNAQPRLIRTVLLVGLGTAAQIAFITGVYFTELRAVEPGISLSQAISYTGAANFSLFVSITPGAIGIRETILLFSQKVHCIGAETITAASVLDRAVYFVVLMVLGLLVLATHASKTFHQATEEGSQSNQK